MFEQRFIIVSLANSYPAYLTHGKAPLFDNVQVTGVDFYFSTALQRQTVFHDSVVEAEIFIGGLLHLFPRFAPLAVWPVYYPVVMVPPANGV
jgi:hypothetical protein